jgi:tRNA nucleotidyltransferase (CCA-adding enzyme)
MKIKEILKKEIGLIKPSSEEIARIEPELKELIKSIEEKIKKQKISAEIFVGGSFAKKTLIKKEKYDIDVFIRFAKVQDEKKISGILQKLLPKNAKKIHGSRDYFSLNKEINETNVDFEIIPVIKIKNPLEAKNIMDLSYFHVNYIKKKIAKTPGLADEIKIAKAFVHFQGCYGAESYINGFSGYALELLIIYYKSFINFIKCVVKNSGEKIVIDTEKFYKNKEAILREVNEAKLSSPIVLIDPTFKERNAVAALSQETFNRFKKSCIDFLKKPSLEFFKKKDNVCLLEKKYKNKLIKLILLTEKQAGDIAGTKLKKFYNFFLTKIERYFKIKEKYFEYDEKSNIGRIYLVLDPRKEIIFSGPPVKMEDRLREFKKEHKKVIINGGKSYAKEKNNLTFEKFLNDFSNKEEKIIREMGISNIEFV